MVEIGDRLESKLVGVLIDRWAGCYVGEWYCMVGFGLGDR